MIYWNRTLSPRQLPWRISGGGRPISTAPAAPDVLLLLLKRCSNFKTLSQAHGFITTGGFCIDNLVVGKFIDACSSLGLVRYAYSVFTNQRNPNTYLHNTMIRAFSQTDDSANLLNALLVFKSIRASSLFPDAYSFPFVLKVAVRLSDASLGKQIHCQTVISGMDSDCHVRTGLIQLYSCSSFLRDARKVFDEMYVRDAAVWNAVITGYAKAGEADEARILLETMPCCLRNVISWTSVISGYTQINQPNEAIEVFQRMQMDNVEPDEVAILSVLSACADLGALELGEHIRSYADKQRLIRTIALNNSLIDMYSKSGNIRKALDVFENMKKKTVVTWTSMISGLAFHGSGKEALEMFDLMENEKVKPNRITFIAILSACSHVGLVDLGRHYFDLMRSKYGIEPEIKHYGCIIDLLGRAGLVQEAEELVTTMPYEANASIWGSLLSAATIYGDLDLGERALRELMKVEPGNSGNYLILSNMYSNVGRWDEARSLRKMMRDSGVKKMVGESFVEVRNRVCGFVAGDTTHPRFGEIDHILQEINLQMKMVEEAIR